MFTTQRISPTHTAAAQAATASKSASFFQPKLTVNTPGDAYEQEADRVADQVMRMKNGDAPVVQRMPITPLSVQRKCAHCEKEEKAMRKETGGDVSGQAAPAAVSDVLSSGGGQPMDSGTRQWAESRFGQDFSQVRVHTDARAAESAAAIQARAYTSGSNVVFGAGEYQPQSESGQRLLAHELVHVGQQGGGASKMVSRLVRTSRVSCGVGQNPYTAERRAVAMLNNTLSVLDAALLAHANGQVTADTERVGRAMWSAFRLRPANNDNWTLPAPRFGLPLIRRRVEMVKNYIDSVVFSYNCRDVGVSFTIPGCTPSSCSATTRGMACHNNPTEISLCPAFWGQSPSERAKTIFHEVFHIVFDFVDDWTSPSGGTSSDSANSHCYSQFVMLINGVRPDRRCHD
jgi:hypothetical protein